MGERQENVEIDAVDPEVCSYAMLVKTIRNKIRARCTVLPMPDSITYLAKKALCKVLGDMVLTREETMGLSRELLVSRSGEPTPCPTKLPEWLDENAYGLGHRYASELQPHYR